MKIRGAFLFVKAVGVALVFYICRISLKIWAKGGVRLLENRVSVLQ